MLARTTNENAPSLGLITDNEAYDAWFRAKVQEALDDPGPDIANSEVEAEFAARRAATLHKLGGA